jgi:glycosyltransferase involved in cell wall biosynthesis
VKIGQKTPVREPSPLRGTVVLSANTSWYLYNFRSGLMKALSEQGWKVVALSPKDEFSDRIVEAGVDWQPLEMSLRGLGPIENARIAWAYLRAYARLKPAVVLHFTIKPVILGSLAARFLRRPAVNTITGLGNAFLRRDAVTKLALALYRPALKRARRVFFQNPEDRLTFLTHRLLIPAQSEIVGGSGINLDRFSPSPVSDEIPFAFLFIGRLLKEKGLVEFVEAARRLRGSTQARFIVIGQFSAEADGGISRATMDGWVEEGLIEYMGPVSDVRPNIAAAQCVVLPSYREGAPRVLLEAGAMGRPCVATDVTGCRDVVVDGETGLLCRARDPADLALKMERMLALSPAQRIEMGARARARVEARYDERKVIAAYLEAVATAEA